MSSDSCRLSDIADVQGGYAFKSADFGSAGVAVVKIANIQPPNVFLDAADRVEQHKLEGLARFELADGDILMAMTGATVGKVARFRKTERAFLNQRVARISAKGGPELNDFIYALVSLPGFEKQIESAAAGSAQANISAAGIGSIAIPLLGRDTQLVIGSIARTIDNRITLLRETNATLEAIAQALFKSWFVDFDPVHANIAAKNAPEGAAQGGASAAQGTTAGMPEAGQRRKPLPPMPAAALDAATAALFPDSFEESELGLVPKGWRIGTVEDLCSQITNGGTPSRSRKDFWDDGSIPWFKTGEFCDGFLLEPSERITEAGVNGSSVKVLPKDAVLMAIYAAPTVGRLGILTEPSTFNQACTGMIAKDFIGPWFLFLTLFFGRDWFNSRANGAAQQNISKAIVAGYSVVIPDERVLSSFNEVAGALFSKIRAGAEQAQTLTQLRDTLLPRLISGQLRLPEAETLLETMP